MTDRSTVTDEGLARLFHETYERLAPQFNYETRKASAKPWSEVPENNRKLMIAVAGEVLKVVEASGHTALLREIEDLRAAVRPAYFEGWTNGYVRLSGGATNTTDMVSDWEKSDSRAALSRPLDEI